MKNHETHEMLIFMILNYFHNFHDFHDFPDFKDFPIFWGDLGISWNLAPNVRRDLRADDAKHACG